MGKRRDFHEAEHARTTLDGVRDTKNGVDGFRIWRSGIQGQQRGLHGVQRLGALLEEGGMEFVKSRAHDDAFRMIQKVVQARMRPAAAENTQRVESLKRQEMACVYAASARFVATTTLRLVV